MFVVADISGTRIAAACIVVLLYLATTAWFLWPARRRRLVPSATLEQRGSAPIIIAYASQTGFAAELAGRTAQSLKTSGTNVHIASLRELQPASLSEATQALFVVSTTGEGDAPDAAAGFVRDVMSTSATLATLRYAVLALGDREYRNFCAFGHRIDRWLRHQGAQPLFDVVEVDNGDEGALRHWQHQLSVIGNSPDLADWEPPRYERWRLTERKLLNPDSAGEPCFHIALRPQADSSATWSAGDIAEIDPRNSTWLSAAHPLPHREYSIASLPGDGEIHLLVRRMRRPDGAPGLGSGWLIGETEPGADIGVRIRVNSNFHVPDDDRPLILIGNGTGIAGLRALLRARIGARRHRNWLIFGERNAAHDFFYGDEIRRWHEQGGIERLDLVFSRDQQQRRYVQHRLSECVDEVRHWLDEGAAIFVCGSLAGMAPGVHAALIDAIGSDALEELVAAGRYRRDVY